MPKNKTIKHVLNELDAIIEECIETNSRLGLFAYIYRRTTYEIATEISLSNFKNNEYLETLDVIFANLYLDAYKSYKDNKPTSSVWVYAFDNANKPLTILQHILLGMNAHINLDLAIATAKTMAGKEINDAEEDFNKVNDILFQITNELQNRISRVSPLMFILDLIGKNRDEKIIDFSMRKAREQSWNSSNLLWSLGEDYNEHAIKKIDLLVLKLSERIKNPKTKTLRFLLKLIQHFESKNVGRIILKLKET